MYSPILLEIMKEVFWYEVFENTLRNKLQLYLLNACVLPKKYESRAAVQKLIQFLNKTGGL